VGSLGLGSLGLGSLGRGSLGSGSDACGLVGFTSVAGLPKVVAGVDRLGLAVGAKTSNPDAC
jgi:hypothetical protein